MVENIIEVADGLVIFYPPGIDNLKLFVFDELLHFLLVVRVEIFIPILEENNLGDEMFPGRRLA